MSGGPPLIDGTSLWSWPSNGFQTRQNQTPHGTELRFRYKGTFYYASIEGDELCYCGQQLSPGSWVQMIAGTVRNFWRDIWIRRSATECWLNAAAWRSDFDAKPLLPFSDRHRRKRRFGD